MNCEELRDHYDLYAWDAAEEPELSEIRAHLDRGCEICMARMKRALQTAAVLGALAPPAEPSRKLRGRVLASVGVEQKGGAWLFGWATAVAFAVIIVFLLFSLRVDQRYEALRSRTALAILYAPETREASFGTSQHQPPYGKVFLSPSQGVLLIASNLPPTPAGKTYEMWLIPKAAKPVPAGLFRPRADGQAMHVRGGVVDLASTSAVAVTVEDQAGAPQPTTTPLIVAALPAL
jgi:hypothetical protein